MEYSVSKHLVRRDLERDPDHINTMLWKRKLYKKRIQRNDVKKVRKQFFQSKDQEEAAPTMEVGVDEKKLEFYKSLFTKTGDEPELKKKKKKKKKEPVVAAPKVEVVEEVKEEEPS